MLAWEEYKAKAKSRGALAHELYMVISTPAGDVGKVQEMLPEHLAYQSEQESLGTLFLAGPISDISGERMGGIGLIIYRAASFEEARRIADADPMHRSGARSYVMRRWLVNEGSMTLCVGLSAQSVGFA